MKILKLHSVSTVLNEKGKKRYEQANNSEERTFEGLTAAQWENLGLPIPEELKNKNEIDKDGYLTIGEDEVEEIQLPLIINTKELSYAKQSPTDDTTILYLKSGKMFIVTETVEQIQEQLNK